MLKLSLSFLKYGLEISISPASTDNHRHCEAITAGLITSFDDWKETCDKYYSVFREALSEGNYPLAHEVMNKLVEAHASATLTLWEMVREGQADDVEPLEQ